MRGLSGKVVLITGALGGIGRGLCERFAAEGSHVAVNCRNDSCAKAGEFVKNLPTEGVVAAGDVTSPTDVEAMVRTAVEKFGKLDVLINNAGIEKKAPLIETTDEDWKKVLAVNLYGPFLLCRAAARVMIGRGGGGRIINNSSVHEDIPFEGFTSYCASKGGLRMLMRNLALELAPYRITVNNIAPGAIATPINQHVLDDPNEKRRAESEIPLGRFGRPNEVASVAAFLASDDAAYVTGSTYFVDGGMTQQVTKY